MSKIFYDLTNKMKKSVIDKVNSKVEERINASRKFQDIPYEGNLLRTQWEGQNEYPMYLQNLMDRKVNITSTNRNATNEKITRMRLNYYQDWRAILRIAPITSIKYAERNYAMFGRGGARDRGEDSGVVKDSKGNITDYNTGLLRVLTEVGGILFPYTPTINVSGKVNWQKTNLVHSNIANYSWENTEPESFDISGDFTVSNPSEGLYCLAIFNFLRTITKGSGPNFGRDNRVQNDISLGRYGGEDGGMAREVPGAAPPVLYFSAYGNGMIHEVPVVVDSYSYQLQNDVDYVELVLDPCNYWQPILDVSDRTNNYAVSDYVIARVPTKFSLSLKLNTSINPIKYNKFSLWDYKNGEYIRPNSRFYKGSVPTGWTW